MKVTLSRKKGLLCWLCIFLWVGAGALLTWACVALGFSENVAFCVGVPFIACFGIVPILFFRHEEKKMQRA